MTQAIWTRYIGPRNTRGSRVKATGGGKSVTLAWDDALNDEANHHAAARKLAAILGWSGEWSSAAWPKGGNVYVRRAIAFKLQPIEIYQVQQAS